MEAEKLPVGVRQIIAYYIPNPHSYEPFHIFLQSSRICARISPMIYYYSATKKTQVYAEVLAQVLGCPVYASEADLDVCKKGQAGQEKQTCNFKLFTKGAFHALVGKAVPVKNMPNIQEIQETEIYICAPVWANAVAPPVKYFLENAVLEGKKLHLLLTAAAPTEKMRTKAQELLSKVDCIPGEVFVFAGSGASDRNLVKEQLQELLVQ